jgi:hypothetical protein
MGRLKECVRFFIYLKKPQPYHASPMYACLAMEVGGARLPPREGRVLVAWANEIVRCALRQRRTVTRNAIQRNVAS